MLRIAVTSLALIVAAAVHAQNASGPGTPLELNGCENVFRAGDKVISGGEPVSEAAFDSLASLGVKTIVSVDGALPNLELARKYGMRYVHLPIGYDGIKEERVLQFGRAVRDLDGPIYFHCHHGKHRGPAAVAAGIVATGEWTHEQADAFLRQVGTSEKYKGLFESIQTLEIPSPEALDAVSTDFPEYEDRSGMVQAMAAMDRLLDNLALAADGDFQVMADHPDIDPKHDALQLYETFRELNRAHKATDWPGGMMQRMMESEALTQQFEKSLRNGEPGSKDILIEIRKRCADCHDRFRNQGRKHLTVPSSPER